jgi:hypothetical protein
MEQQVAFEMPAPATMSKPEAWIRRLGALPLLHQAGEKDGGPGHLRARIPTLSLWITIQGESVYTRSADDPVPELQGFAQGRLSAGELSTVHLEHAHAIEHILQQEVPA